MALVSLIILLVFGSTQFVCANSSNATSESVENVYRYFGTRTVYDFVRKDIVRPTSDCQAVQIWMLARHGTRYGTKSDTEKFFKAGNIRNHIIENHKNGGELNASVLKKLSDWQLEPDVKIESAEELTLQGKQDLYQLAKRLRNVFPELLKVDAKNVKPGDFIFRSTDTNRTKSSLVAFAEGLFGTSDVIVPPELPPDNDTLLWAYNNCPAWETRYYEDHYDEESNKFAIGPEVIALLRQVKHRLGFDKPLDYDTVRSLYNLCRFETAWHPENSSIWCSVFVDDELKILEYQEDLDHYYYCGPGRQWNSKLGCQTLNDMLARFKDIVDKGHSQVKPRGVFYFGHTATLQTFMAALGTDGGSSNPLRADNYSTRQNRKYRTSLLGPFATNVIAALYQCTGSTTPSYSISFYTSEQLESIEGCHSGLCNWDFIERKYRSDIQSCSMDFC